VNCGRAADPIPRRFFRLSHFKVPLPGIRCLNGIHARTQAGLFKEESPAFVGIGRALAVLVLTHDSFGVLASLDNLYNSSGYVGTNVVADQDVGRFQIVVGQRILRVAVGSWNSISRRVPVLDLPVFGRARAACESLRLERADVLSLPAFGPLGYVELHRLALLEALEAACLDCREVHKYIFASLTADKAVAFGIVKPLYCSLFCHFGSGVPFNRFTLEGIRI
jgi:hypothetical protein